ncbi:hypothetical protein [Paraburkholderia tropica]|uniref:hypothetical protein n=1 Tax=Paraburkholderia tropica TaxID=92647 RepID=UPI001591350D|nr:hypothetical protein [Paraburkholderia tropica]
MVSECNAIRSSRAGVEAERQSSTADAAFAAKAANANHAPAPVENAQSAASSPVRRALNTFFKLLYRHTHSRAWRHNERIAHGVTLERDATGRLTGMRIGGRSLPCVNGTAVLPLPDARECHLIATGPSINEIDYRALAMPRVMGVNGAIALQERAGVRFDYYCIVDTGFARQRVDLVERVIREPLTLFATPVVLWHIVQRFGVERLRCRVFLVDDMLFPAGRRAVEKNALRTAYDERALALFDAPHTLGFSLDLRRGVFDGCTVAYTGLQVLAALGFRRILLHGVDLANAALTPRFYESAANMQPSHLDEDFRDIIEPSFRGAAGLLARRGVEVRNLSMQSALGEDVFPKLHWQALIARGASAREAGERALAVA